MATLYVSSIDGNDSSPASVAWWDGSHPTYASISQSLTSSRDSENIIYVDSNHNYTCSAAINWNLPTASLTMVISTDRSNGFRMYGASEYIGLNGGAFNIMGTQAIGISSLYVYGVKIIGNNGNSSGNNINICYNYASNTVTSATFENCLLWSAGSNNVKPVIGHSSISSRPGNSARFLNCHFKLANNTSTAGITLRGADIEMFNCTSSFTTGSVKPSLLFQGNGTITGKVLIANCDWSAYDKSGGIIISNSGFYDSNIVFQNCKLSRIPALTNDFPSISLGGHLTFINCDSGSRINTVNYITSFGTVSSTGSIYYKSGSYFDGSGISWKVLPNSKSNKLLPCYTPWMNTWNDITGSYLTASVKFIVDEIEPTDDVIWAEFEYPNESNSTRHTMVSTRNTDLAIDVMTGNTYTVESSDNWITGPISIPSPYSIKSYILPMQKGLVRARVGMLSVAGSNGGVWIDPMVHLN